jgi:hypothetical protein
MGKSWKAVVFSRGSLTIAEKLIKFRTHAVLVARISTHF